MLQRLEVAAEGFGVRGNERRTELLAFAWVPAGVKTGRRKLFDVPSLLVVIAFGGVATATRLCRERAPDALSSRFPRECLSAPGCRLLCGC